MKGIPVFNEINDLHQATGSALRTGDPLFHCFSMAEANDLTITTFPPHRAGFYTLALNLGTQQLEYTLNTSTFMAPEHFLLFVAPGQVVRWEKGGRWQGYCAFFKGEFLQFNHQINFLQQYPFFNISETNLLPIHPGEAQAMETSFRQLIDEQAHSALFGREIAISIFQTILWQARRIYEEASPLSASKRATDIIAAQFQYLVNEHFLQATTIEAYATLLNITPNHLSQTISQATGNTAKSIITRRRIAEACYLLAHTPNSVAEIANHLSFGEPTHFTRFFRSAMGVAPQQYRKQQTR